jgi:protein tyrosine phosphatase (PTP) superfamily phosphohydrolase (DUF442 family)
LREIGLAIFQQENAMRDLSEVLNWRRLNSQISLSGQPTEAQLSDIKALGFTHIINLGPHTNKGALADEAGTVAKLGMIYVYIPVDFANPTTQDFVEFCEVLEQLQGQTIHVHCIYNARVSAFFYRYAQIGKGGSEADALALMDGIWRPGGVWAQFVGNSADTEKPNRYAGEDY